MQFDFFVASLDNRNLKGFGWMNYKRSKDELRFIAKKISRFKFKQKSLEIYDGANIFADLDYAQWEERCKNLLETFFSRDGKHSGIILFPDIEITLTRQSCQLETWQRVMITLSDWCEILSPEDATGLIIRNYDLVDHLKFCGITEHKIKDTLEFNDSASTFNFQDSDTRFLIFNPSLKIILIIRLVELQEGDFQLVKNEVDHCINEVKLLCFLLKDEMKHTGVIVTGLVVYSGEMPHSQSACEDCDIIISFEKFSSVEALTTFWESFSSKVEIRDLEISLAKSVKKDKENVFEAVASKIIGYLAHFQFGMLQEPVLPVIQGDPTGNLEQAKLLLKRYQMEIAYSDDKRIWLEGTYGTGKTVVACKKLELLLKVLKNKEVIYYINYAGKSPLHLKIKENFERNKNVRVISGEYILSDIIRHQILQKEREIGTKNIHLIVDEYNSQDLSTKEVESLTTILNKEKELKNSTVLIAAQPIKISRVEHFCQKGIKTKISETKHNLNQLVAGTGMKVKILKNVMRTTKQINKLAEITREYLNSQSNRCVRQLQNSESRLNLEEETDSNLNQKKSKETDFNHVLSATSDDSLSRATSNVPEKLIDYDEKYKLVHAEIMEGEKNYQETLTSYSFTCHSQIGHNIDGPLPQLIKFAEPAEPLEQIALIAALFDKIIEPTKTKSNRTTVIHLESEDPPLWLKSLLQLRSISPSLTVTTKVEEFLKNKNENLVLVKNLNFLRGLEFSKVLLILDSNEHHLRHLIPEAITRCKENLTILIRPLVRGKHLSGTVKELADEWEKHLDTHIIKILEIGFCLKPLCNNKKVQLEAYCKDKGSFGTYYGVHRNSKLYTVFLESTQHQNIANMQPEHKEKQKEAEAV